MSVTAVIIKRLKDLEVARIHAAGPAPACEFLFFECFIISAYLNSNEVTGTIRGYGVIGVENIPLRYHRRSFTQPSEVNLQLG